MSVAQTPGPTVGDQVADPIPDSTVTRVVIPGHGALEFVRTRTDGSLLEVRGGSMTYLRVDAAGRWHWSGICVTTEHKHDWGMSRQVSTPHGQWVEGYRWNDGQLCEVDGVLIRRDNEGRVTACVPGGEDPAPSTHRWIYSYGVGGPTHISGPPGQRHIAEDGNGIALSISEDGDVRPLRHDQDGVRTGAGRPLDDHVDDAGRLWAEMNANGTVRYLYIWDGTRCLARIDGPPGSPLAAVFSLDPSATPVRVIGATGSVRIPRDVYGEALLEHRGVPGIFGGQLSGGLVHLPLRRLDPRTGRFCEPDPMDGSDSDPRRAADPGHRFRNYEGALPAEPKPCSTHEVCRGDPIGRADPTGGVSAGLIISDLTWSFQNNILSFFGIDWWFNLFASLIVAPFKGIGDGIDYDFFSSTGLTASDRHGGFGVRRGGIINAITGGRAFTTQHIVWSPDREYAELEHGEVLSFASPFQPTHYGTILSTSPQDHPRGLLECMNLNNRDWVDPANLDGWSRHGGLGRAAAPGAITPVFPDGGIHLDSPREDTRGELSCPVDELHATAVAAGDLEDRTLLTAPGVSGLAADDLVLADDGTTLAISRVIAVLPTGGRDRIQLEENLGSMTASSLSLTEVTGPVTSDSHGAGPNTSSIDMSGTATTYAANDLLHLASGSNTTAARVQGLEARVPIDRPLPMDFGGPIAVSIARVSPVITAVTMSGSNIEFGTTSRPGQGALGLLSGDGTTLAVRVETHVGTNEVTLDVAVSAAISGASSITWQSIGTGTAIGTRAEAGEADPFITYAPLVAGAAPDGSGTPLVLRFDSAMTAHVRTTSSAPVHDLLVLDRTVAGSGPFIVERFTVGGSPVRDVSRSDVVGLVVDDPARFSSAPAVFLTKVDGEPPIPGAVTLSGVDVVDGVVSTTPGSPVSGLEPGRPVLIGTRVAAIRSVRLTSTFDASLDLAATGLLLVALDATGPANEGKAISATEVALQSTVSGVSVSFPRFAVGDLVQVSTTSPSPVVTWHRITAVDGGRLTLVDGPALTATNDVVVTAVAVVDPVDGGSPAASTGGFLLGIEGTRTGTGSTNSATFTVWSSDALSSGRAVGIIDGDVTHPTTITAAAQPLELRFSEFFSATGVDVAPTTASTVATSFLPTLALDGGILLLDGAAGNLAMSANESLIVVAYESSGNTATGTLGTGTLLVPEGEETEVSRSQSLTDHELTHTLQYSRWGPLWFNLFPMLAMELPGILATDTELPEFSAFFQGTIEVGDSNRWTLNATSLGGVSVSVGDELQIVQGSRRSRAKVRSISGTRIELTPTGTNPASGAASVRKLQQRSVFDGFFAFFDLLTHGGLVNLLAGSTWGGIFWLIGKAFYGLGRAIGGSGDLYRATVQSAGVVTLSNEDDAQHLDTSGMVVVRQGDDTVVRTMNRANSVITFTENIAFTGEVHVAPYDTHEPGSEFDWYDYHPATVDPDNPFVIEVASGGGGDPPTFSPEDRVVIRYRTNSPRKTDVLSVSGTSVELLDPITIVGGETSLRIAKVGSSDPLGNADSAAMVEMGMGWMKWIFDPYGQIEHAVQPQQEWSQWLLRVMRWILGTQNFSLLPFGYLWWGRLFPTMAEHETPIEQEASEESGDLYSPLGRLTGEGSDDGFARRKMLVGEIARYRYWPLDRTATFVTAGQFDSPGVHYTQQTRTMPNRTDSSGGSNPPNEGIQVDPSTQPGLSVAAQLVIPDPNPAASPDPLGFRPSELGSVPVSARTQRVMSAYVGFTRPGDHRVTVDNNIPDTDRSLDVHRLERQQLFYDITAEDVNVSIAGRTVDDSNPGTSDTISLVPFQRARATVTPSGSRAYRLTVLDPDGPVGRDGSLGLVGNAVSTSPARVEISRWHANVNGRYTSGGLAFAGMHLSRHIHIAVRQFNVDVVDTLPLRSSADLPSPEVTSIASGGGAFLLVPAPVVRPPEVLSVAGNPPAASDPNPATRVDAPSLATYLGTSGGAFRIAFPSGATTGVIVLGVTVGTGTNSTVLRTTFTLT